MPPPFSNPPVESSPKRVRVLFGGVFVVDTKEALLVWEHPYYPTYFFPTSALPAEYIQRSKSQPPNQIPGVETYDLVLGDRVSKGAVEKYLDGVEGHRDQGLVKVIFGKADAWFEEDEEIFVHAKDPYKRVDVLQSSRHVRVEVKGVEVANTSKPRFLYETLLPVRTYIPKTDCRLDLFEESALQTQCPYKGTAEYYSIRLSSATLLRDVVWWYHAPLAAVTEIRGYVAFYDEMVDVWIDGVKQERPKPRE